MHIKNADVTIIGAGIAGLSAALGLAKVGKKVTLLEKSAQLQEVGAGLQLSPNVTKILKEWDLLEACQKHCLPLHSLNLRDGYNGKTLLSFPIDKLEKTHWRSPYLSIHRADLQNVLLRAVLAHPSIQLIQNAQVQTINRRNDTIILMVKINADVKIHESAYVFCADGVWSKMRETLVNEKAFFSGYLAWRLTISNANLPSAFVKKPAVNAWCGENNHIVTYPLRNGELYNIVAITGKQDLEHDHHAWVNNMSNMDPFKDAYKGWYRSLTDAISGHTNWTYWPLFIMPSIRLTHSTRIYFLGDASHAILPFSAQGAAMAIEDAYILSGLFAKLSQPRAISAQYQKLRLPRLKKILLQTNFHQKLYHATSWFAFARNTAFTCLPGSFFIRTLDWLYKYDAKKALKS